VSFFRKKPVVIEAIQFSGNNWSVLDRFTNGRVSQMGNGEKATLDVITLEGKYLTARVGDWIIKGVAGEVYPCKPDIFEQTYEAVASNALKA
jgi:hypothetical protein